MATLSDIGVAAGINLLSAFVFLLAFAILRLQPFNDRVYFPKWYLKGLRSSPSRSGTFVKKFVNLDFRSYLRFLNWMPEALKMPELELIDHAGLDSAVYLRIYLIGLKIFVPITFLAWAVLVPVNYTNKTLELQLKNVTSSDIDKLSISNVPDGSDRFWTHIVMAYAFTFWTCYVLLKEYEKVANMRLQFLVSEKRRPDQFTVLVRNVPPDSDESVSETVEHFFLVNHPDTYLTHQVVCNANKLAKLVKKRKSKQNWLDYYQLKYSRNNAKRPIMKTGFLGLWGKKVDAIDHHITEIKKLSDEIAEERERVLKDPKSIMPAAFVSFKSRWGAAVCAQTQQSRNPTLWLTDWAPEPRDVYWQNLSIPYVSIAVRRLIMAVAFFFLTFFFIIPIASVQALATIEGLEKAAPFLKALIEIPFIKSVIQGFLPGIVLKLFLIFLPTILMIMSKFEGFTSVSSLERRSSARPRVQAMTVAAAATAHSKKLMKLTLSLFGNGFNSSKCKTAAKMAVARIKLLRNKRQVVLKQMRRDIALLLQSGQDATARIRVEHVMREQNVLAANEFIELFCELVVARLSIIKKRRECPADLKEGIASLIFAAPRCAEIPELIEIRNIFEKKYGRDFVAAATDLRPNCGVNRLLIDKLSVKTPTGEAKLKVMKEIAKDHNIEWDTTESEKELLKPPEELIEGPRTFVSATSLPVKPATNHCPEPKESMTRKLCSRGEEGHNRFKDTVAAAEAAEESAKKAITAAQAAAYLANRESNLFSEASGCVGNAARGSVPTSPPGTRRMYESRSFGTFNPPSTEDVRPGNNGGGKTCRRHSYNHAPAAHSDIKFDESDCDEEIEIEDYPVGSTDLPPPVPSLEKQDSSIHRVHPKLPDYDDLAARFEALKYRKSLP